ncbi:MAG: hypothetical protein ACYDBB_18585 [Armatimonadota bacterium]
MDADTFECIRCGKTIYHAATYCPHCGLELYPEGDDEESTVEDAERQPEPRRCPPFIARILKGVVGERIFRNLFHRTHHQNAQVAKEDDLYLELLQRLDFDHARVQRLLEQERTTAQSIDRCELLRRAIGRWERDNR